MNNEIIEISLLKEKCNKSNRQIEIYKYKKCPVNRYLLKRISNTWLCKWHLQSGWRQDFNGIFNVNVTLSIKTFNICVVLVFGLKFGKQFTSWKCISFAFINYAHANNKIYILIQVMEKRTLL